MRRLTIAVLAAFFALAGCGEDEPGEVSRRLARGEPDPEHVREVARNPYLVTCADLAAQPRSPEASRLVIQAVFALAQVPELRRVVAKETLNRTGRSVYYGLTEECKGGGRRSSRRRQPWPACCRGSTGRRGTGRGDLAGPREANRGLQESP